MSKIVPKSNITQGVDDTGRTVNQSMTPEGHAEVAIHAPRLPFCSVHTENFTSVGSASSAYWDVAATGMTSPTQSQKILDGSIVESGSFDHVFGDKEITLQPGETICLCVKSLSATADCVGSLNTRKDQ